MLMTLNYIKCFALESHKKNNQKTILPEITNLAFELGLAENSDNLIMLFNKKAIAAKQGSQNKKYYTILTQIWVVECN